MRLVIANLALRASLAIYQGVQETTTATPRTNEYVFYLRISRHPKVISSFLTVKTISKFNMERRVKFRI